MLKRNDKFNFRIESEIADLIRETAEMSRRSPSEIIRESIINYLTQLGFLEIKEPKKVKIGLKK